jgi:hypothetical protein
MQQPGRGVGDPAGDRGERAHPGHEHRGAQRQHRRRGVLDPPLVTRVLQQREVIEQVHDRQVDLVVGEFASGETID